MRSLLGAILAPTVNIRVTIITNTAATTTATTTTTTTTITAISGFISACFNQIAHLIIGCL